MVIQRMLHEPAGGAVEQIGDGVCSGPLRLFTNPGFGAEHQQQAVFVLLTQLPDSRLLLVIEATAVAFRQTKMPGHFAVQI